MSILRLKENYSYVLYFSASIFVIISTSLITSGNNLVSRWSVFLIFTLSLIILSFLFSRKNSNFRKLNNFQKISFLLISLNIFLFFKLILFYKESSLAKEFVQIYLFFIVFYLLNTFKSIKTYGYKEFFNQISSVEFQIFNLFFLSLSFTRFVKNVANILSQDYFRTFIFILFIFYLMLNFIHKLKNKYVKSQSIFYISIVSLFIFSFRSDSINNVEGSGFHWSYYVGVLKTLKSGGTLLIDTPSQYGFLNLFIPSLFPFSNVALNFYLFQSFIFIIFALLLFYIFIKYNENSKFNYLILFTYFLSLFFADPELIGPQLYPSSSLMRFFPSAILLLFIYYITKTSQTDLKNQKILALAFIVFVSTIWSAESFIYTLIISFFILIFYFLNLSRFNFLILVKKFVIFYLIMLIIFIITYYGMTGNSIDLTMHFMYAFNYAQGFGSYPLALNSPIWIFFISAIYIIYLQLITNSNFNLIFFSSIGALIAWSTYYIGRAVPDNIIALSPLIVYILLLNITSNSNTSLNFKVYAPFYIFLLLITINLIINPTLKDKLINFRSFTTSISNPIKAKPDLISFLNQIPIKDRETPIVYSGHLGVLPNLNKSKLNISAETWLPIPTSLLQEPIELSKQEVILERFITSAQIKSGFLILDKENSFPDRYLALKNSISKFYICSLYLESDKWLLDKCVLR